jgi:hypothetical protein
MFPIGRDRHDANMRSGKIRRVLSTLGGAIAIAVLLAPSAGARTKEHTTVVDGTFSDNGFLTGFEGVSPQPPEGVFHGTSHVQGAAMNGDVSYTLWGSPNPAGYFDFHTTEIFQGFVAGCGDGTIGTMTYDVVGTADPSTSRLQGTWTIVGSGSGGLSGVHDGGGQLDGMTGPTATSPDPTANSGTITGIVHCVRSGT